MNINFENIAYEDALTILSYAMPHPITMTLQKPSKNTASTTSIDNAELDEGMVPTHPIYRSQSCDDVRKISSAAGGSSDQAGDIWVVPRRTWSEMKKGQHPMKKQQDDVFDAEDNNGGGTGQLRKWGAQHDMVFTDSALTVQAEVNKPDGTMFMIQRAIHTSLFRGETKTKLLAALQA